MGGLVFKKAYILGQSDPQYRDIVRSIRSALFFSTPHRGTNLAELLNRILTVSIFNHSPKQYVTELQRNSPALQDISEQFRNVAPKLQLFSLYETQPTPMGPKKLMVLEKDSSILGYPNEVSKALDADHHNVCKYTGTDDPNYVSVRNILRLLLGRHSAPKAESTNSDLTFDDQKLKKFLGIATLPDEDYDFFYSRWMPGTCEWIRADENFLSWVEDDSLRSRVLWLHGVPGAGKSVIASYIIKHLSDVGASRHFFFFKHGEQPKRSMNAFLRSMAYQIATEVHQYRILLSKMAGDLETVEKSEARSLWQKLFVKGLFTLRLARPLCWVLDALDECDTPLQLVSMFSDITTSHMPLRILIVSRKTQALSMNLQRMGEIVKLDTLSADSAVRDLQHYVTKEMEYVPGRPDFKAKIMERILEKAEGNFLWVHLVVMSIAQCHTEAAIEETLNEMPAELEPLYQRMESSLVLNLHPRDQELTKIILTWATCSRRSLTSAELAQALLPTYPNLIDLDHTVVKLCGGFVIVDSRGHIAMVHQTAREYLTKTSGRQYSVSPRIAHRDLFLKCIAALSNPTQRLRPDLLSTQPFLLYASTSWSYHLSLSVISLDHLQTITLTKFFQSPSVLTWIHTLALTGQLTYLVRSSQSITSYLAKQARMDAENSPLSQRLQEKECLESWATDLIKIVGKFRTNLTKHPRSIYKLIPTFCPKTSLLYRQFGPKRLPGSLEVTGIPSSTWDDCLAKFQVDRNTQALKVECGDKFFAILTSSGTLGLYYTLTCEEVRTFAHKERVLCFDFDRSWHKLVTYGFRTTKVWDVRSGVLLQSFPNPRSAKALAISFLGDEDVVISCSDDRAVRRAALDSSSEGWTILETNPGGSGYQGKTFNSPRRVAYSADGAQVAIAYRGFPLIVWAINPPGFVGYCERFTDRNKRNQDLWTEIGPICWNAITGHVLGLYADGCIFKWHPLESESYELKTVAADIQCSPSGNVFVTSSVDGTLRVWNFHHFALIYTLSCHTPVTALAISPDGGRIYDLRDTFCHIWEPNALIRLTEADDEVNSDTSSTLGGFSQASEASSEMSPPVTALAVNPPGSIYCVADDAGSLRVHDRHNGTILEVSKGFLPIEHAVWDRDGRILVTADLGGNITVWSKEESASAKVVQFYFEASVKKSIRQLLISHQSDYFLAVTQGFNELWSIGTRLMVTSYSSSSMSSRWTQHPSQDKFLPDINITRVTIHNWNDSSTVASFALEALALDVFTQGLHITDVDTAKETHGQGHIDKTLTTSDGSRILVQFSTKSTDQSQKHQFTLISSSELSVQQIYAEQSMLKARKLPPSVNDRIESLIGFVSPSAGRGFLVGIDSEDVLVFLDHDSWVCSWALGEGEGEEAVKRYFFLPQDWLNSDYFRHCAILRDGTLFFPKNGEVAVILNGLREAWLN